MANKVVTKNKKYSKLTNYKSFTGFLNKSYLIQMYNDRKKIVFLKSKLSNYGIENPNVEEKNEK